MKLSEAAKKAIQLADACRSYWDRELPKRHPHYPLIRADEDSGPAPPEQQQLESLLRSLPEEQVYALLLPMYIGRGDFGTSHLEESYNALKDTFEKPEFAISQMTGKGVLGEYLSDGLEELQRHKIDVDGIRFPTATTPRHV
jgi:Protein of unknown function (DUF3775)